MRILSLKAPIESRRFRSAAESSMFGKNAKNNGTFEWNYISLDHYHKHFNSSRNLHSCVSFTSVTDRHEGPLKYKGARQLCKFTAPPEDRDKLSERR